MKHAGEPFDVDVPDDFPVEALAAIHAHLAALPVDEAGDRRLEWREWASASNGLLWRFRACDEHSEALVASLRGSGAPPTEERYQQEKWLFAFFVEGLSAVECLYYGLYFVGALADPTTFEATIDPKLVTPSKVAGCFSRAFESDQLTKGLVKAHGGEELKLWRDVRNVLTHRGSPPRHHFLHEPSRWGLSKAASGLLEPEQIEERRERIGAAVAEIAGAAVPFVHARINGSGH